MASTVAAPAKPAPSVELDAKEKKQVDAICRSAFLMATSVALCVPARAPLVLAMKNGDAAATAQTMGLMSSTAALIEFLLNPVLGRLSDKYGRKPFLLMSTMVNAFLHSLVALMPGSLPINILDRCISGAMIFAFFNPMGAALQDLFASQPMEKIGGVGAKMGAFFGLGFAFGPLLGSKLGGGKAFAASAVMFAATAVSIQSGFEETLPADKVKEFDITAINPFSFVKLFSTRAMAQLSSTVAFGSFAEYANIYDINFLFMKSVMGYGQEEVGKFAAGFGVTQIGGGIMGKSLIAKLGTRTHTLLSNMAYIAGFGLLGAAKSGKQLVLALLCLMFGHQRSSYPSTLLAEHATKTGMGRGEIAGATANFLAVLKIIAPSAYGRVFAWATSGGRNMPGLPYFFICIFVACAQLTFSKHLQDQDAEKKD